MKRYADDYDVVVTEDEKGREKKTAVYGGKFFDVTIDQENLIKFRSAGMILIALIIVLHVGAGFVANQGMYAFYVAVPYIIAFLPLYYMTSGILRLPKTKRKYRRDEIGLSFKRVKKASIALAVILGVGVIGEVVFLIWFANEVYIREWMYLVVQVVGAAIAYLLVHIQKPVRVIPLDGENQE
jgi:hypothetical protein